MLKRVSVGLGTQAVRVQYARARRILPPRRGRPADHSPHFASVHLCRPCHSLTSPGFDKILCQCLPYYHHASSSRPRHDKSRNGPNREHQQPNSAPLPPLPSRSCYTTLFTAYTGRPMRAIRTSPPSRIRTASTYARPVSRSPR